MKANRPYTLAEFARHRYPLRYSVIEAWTASPSEHGDLRSRDRERILKAIGPCPDFSDEQRHLLEQVYEAAGGPGSPLERRSSLHSALALEAMSVRLGLIDVQTLEPPRRVLLDAFNARAEADRWVAQFRYNEMKLNDRRRKAAEHLSGIHLPKSVLLALMSNSYRTSGIPKRADGEVAREQGHVLIKMEFLAGATADLVQNRIANGDLVFEAVTVTAVEAAEAASPPQKGGRPPKYEWSDFYIEIVLRGEEDADGLPEQAAFTREMLEWCERRWPGFGNDSDARKFISKLYRERSKRARSKR